ncbi:MAG: hypothetical protein LIO79_00920 [Rikenellaceae bacterium]|nr:hypothetical protein [Rikenellaceae bacterium]
MLRILPLLGLVICLLSCGTSGQKKTGTDADAEETEAVLDPLTDNFDPDNIYWPEHLYIDEETVSAEFRETELQQIAEEIAEYDELREWLPYDNPYDSFYVRGNFYGDRGDDLAVLLRHVSWEEKDERHRVTSISLCIINKGIHGIRMVEIEEQGITDFYWVGNFDKISAGEPLWSNYEDDFRSFEEVPDEEIVYLDYDALYVHVFEACGGGFIFWQDNGFNWL